MKARTLSLVVLLQLLAIAFAGRELALVKAGLPPFADIKVLSKKSSSNRICVQEYPKGVSIVCRGSDVLPPVRFFVNKIKVQSEGREPFHIAGDYDQDGLMEILKWDDFTRTPTRKDGTKHMDIVCEHATPARTLKMLNRTVIVESQKCKR